MASLLLVIEVEGRLLFMNFLDGGIRHPDSRLWTMIYLILDIITSNI